MTEKTRAPSGRDRQIRISPVDAGRLMILSAMGLLLAQGVCCTYLGAKLGGIFLYSCIALVLGAVTLFFAGLFVKR